MNCMDDVFLYKSIDSIDEELTKISRRLQTQSESPQDIEGVGTPATSSRLLSHLIPRVFKLDKRMSREKAKERVEKK